ncbi:MAG: hypothetical protein QM796_13245 [Chthoniobacteraceae bacterium]
MSRNTPIIATVIYVLGDLVQDKERATELLEAHFANQLITDVGHVNDVAELAYSTMLAINEQECGKVLDFIGRMSLVRITVYDVEKGIIRLFRNRFIDPEPPKQPQK